jgi:hypothetical protein
MSRTDQQHPRHLHKLRDLRTVPRARVRWVGLAGLVVVALLLILAGRALTRPTPTTAVNQPAPRSAPVSAPVSASAAPRPVLSTQCGMALAATTRMVGHADAVAANLRAHKKLMDDYKSGKIDRAAAIPQGSPWRQALARTLKEGAAAADQYDADKTAYRKAAAQCSNGG